MLCWLYTDCCVALYQTRFTERSSEAVNLIMSHWARLKAELIDQLLGEQARNSKKSADDRPVTPAGSSSSVTHDISVSYCFRNTDRHSALLYFQISHLSII